MSSVSPETCTVADIEGTKKRFDIKVCAGGGLLGRPKEYEGSRWRYGLCISQDKKLTTVTETRVTSDKWHHEVFLIIFIRLT